MWPERVSGWNWNEAGSGIVLICWLWAVERSPASKAHCKSIGRLPVDPTHQLHALKGRAQTCAECARPCRLTERGSVNGAPPFAKLGTASVSKEVP
jgi:hypothetical protein